MVTGIAMTEEYMSIAKGHESNVTNQVGATEGLGMILDDFVANEQKKLKEQDSTLLKILSEYGFLSDSELKVVTGSLNGGDKCLRDVLVDQWISAETYKTLVMFMNVKKCAE